MYFFLENKHENPFLRKFIVNCAIFREDLGGASDQFRGRHGASGDALVTPGSEIYTAKYQNEGADCKVNEWALTITDVVTETTNDTGPKLT